VGWYYLIPDPYLKAGYYNEIPVTFFRVIPPGLIRELQIISSAKLRSAPSSILSGVDDPFQILPQVAFPASKNWKPRTIVGTSVSIDILSLKWFS
jgi:hypothetical protein